MRHWIDLIEGNYPSRTVYDPEFAKAVKLWTESYSQEDTHTGATNAEERRIIEMARQYSFDITGWLFRGQYIEDSLVPRLLAGETVTIEPMKRLIFSWSRSETGARSFAEVYADQNQSTVLLQINASSLQPIVDCQEVTGEWSFEEEIICINQPLVITLKDVVDLWQYDADKEQSVKIHNS